MTSQVSDLEAQQPSWMADYIRRLVSGDKARFKDGQLNLDLDLVYLTDQVIVMGYPATGIEGWYRNRREDAKKFLESRHDGNFWVFNFCPVRENSYDPSFFDGRVSRYPFPDNQCVWLSIHLSADAKLQPSAPPLAIMPLVAREMRVWLHGLPERVAVLHCKAGKGRSGTMACAYLLTLDDDLSPPILERSHPAEKWAEVRAERTMEFVPEDIEEATQQVRPDTFDSPDVPERTTPAPPGRMPSRAASSPRTLKAVLDLHTSRRMKTPASPNKKVKQGVSIPSQRRWLHYWALLLAHVAPAHFWLPPEPGAHRPKVQLTRVRIRMRGASGAKIGLMRAANVVLERTRGGVKNENAKAMTGNAHVWASLARYDDGLVGMLEKWEWYTRDERRIGVRKPGTEYMGEEDVRRIFETNRWDREKMVRTFARMGAVGEGSVVKEALEGKKDKLEIYELRPLTNQKWDTFREEFQDEPGDWQDLNKGRIPASKNNSMDDLTQSPKERGIVLDAGREVRVKLYMGQVFMGWLWFIPTFHMTPSSEGPTTFRLTHKELDFSLGIGGGIVDVEIEMEWLSEADAESVQRLPTPGGAEQAEGSGAGLGGLAAALTAGVGINVAVEAVQAAQD